MLPSKEFTTCELAREISFSTAIGAVKVMAVLEAFIELLPKHLTDGKLLRLGNLSNFKLNIHSRGEVTEEKITNQSIKGIKLIFRPSKELSRLLENIEFRKVTS